jgi:hypothetical protein
MPAKHKPVQPFFSAYQLNMQDFRPINKVRYFNINSSPFHNADMYPGGKGFLMEGCPGSTFQLMTEGFPGGMNNELPLLNFLLLMRSTT